MAVHASHASLPYCVKNARYTFVLEHKASTTGIPTDPGTPDTEFSLDGGAFADCAEEVSVITGSNGMSYMTLTGAETNGSFVAVASKAGSGSTTTQKAIPIRTLPIMFQGTAHGGAAGYLEMPAASATVPFFDCTGAIIRTTGGTGGGGTGGANNQARVITGGSLVGGFLRLSVTPNWETNPDNTTTFDILQTEIWCNATRVYDVKPLWAGALSAIAATSITLPSGHGLDHEGNYLAVLTLGTNAVGKSRYLTYSGSGEVWTVDPAWDSDAETIPSGGIAATIWPAPKIPTTSLPRVRVDNVAGTAQTGLDLGAALAAPVTPAALPTYGSSSISAFVAFLAARAGLAKRTFNKSTGVETQRNAADNASLGTATHSDDGTTVTRNKIA